MRLLLRSVARVAFAELLSLARCARERQLGHLVRAYGDVIQALPAWRGRRHRANLARAHARVPTARPPRRACVRASAAVGAVPL